MRYCSRLLASVSKPRVRRPAWTRTGSGGLSFRLVAMLYGWFFYPLFRLGEEQLYRVCEAAAAVRYTQLCTSDVTLELTHELPDSRVVSGEVNDEPLRRSRLGPDGTRAPRRTCARSPN